MLNKFLPVNIRYSLLSEVGKGEIDYNLDPTEGLRVYQRNLRTIIQLAEKNGTKVILSTYCQFLYDEIKNDETHLLYQKIVAQENEVMKNLAKKYQLELVDNAGTIEKEMENFVDSIHFTPKGMNAIAKSFSMVIKGDN